MNFKEWLGETLNSYAYGQGSDLFFLVYDERDFETTSAQKRLAENEIAVVVSALPSELSYYLEVKPYSLYALLTDSVDMTEALDLLRGFSVAYSLKSITSSYTEDGETYKRIDKLQFEQPQVITDFTYYGNDYAAVCLLSSTITTISRAVDLVSASITNRGVVSEGTEYGITYITLSSSTYSSLVIKPISFSASINSYTNSEVFAGNDFGKSVVTSSSLAISFSVPAVKDAFSDVIYSWMNGSGTDRDRDFRLAFYLNGNKCDLTLKLISVKYETAPDGAPTLALGFSL